MHDHHATRVSGIIIASRRIIRADVVNVDKVLNVNPAPQEGVGKSIASRLGRYLALAS
jgi:hypothetical protein